MGTLRKHTPTQGRNTAVYMALLPKGERTAPVVQTLVAGGFTGSVTITAATSTESYVAVVAGTAHTVVAGTTDTKKTIAKALVASINAGTTGAKALNLRLSGSDYRFDVYRATTFTLANTGTTTVGSLTVSTITGAGTGAAVGATSITLPVATLGKIAAGQFLQFVDSNGVETLAELTATAAAGATTLSVAALPEAISTSAIALYPPEFTDRDNASLPDKFNWSGFKTFNTGGFEDAAFTGASADFDAAGIYYEFCPVYQTLSKTGPEGREHWLTIQFDSPKEGWTGRKREAVVGLDSRDQPVKVDGFISANFKGKVLSAPVETPAILDV